MTGQGYSAGAVNGGPRWPLLFAKEPEPDLDLELDESEAARKQPSSSGSPTPQKPPRLRMLILILLVLIVAGGAYIAMDPETVMTLIGQESPIPASPTPPVTAGRPVTAPRPSPPVRMDADGSRSLAAPGTIPTPLFGEGQHVSVVANPDSPGMGPSLSQDAAETMPGSMVRPRETLLVLDAELHNNRWVYWVRTDAGTKGWIAETHLTAKP